MSKWEHRKKPSVRGMSEPGSTVVPDSVTAAAPGDQKCWEKVCEKIDAHCRTGVGDHSRSGSSVVHSVDRMQTGVRFQRIATASSSTPPTDSSSDTVPGCSTRWRRRQTDQIAGGSRRGFAASVPVAPGTMAPAPVWQSVPAWIRGFGWVPRTLVSAGGASPTSSPGSRYRSPPPASSGTAASRWQSSPNSEVLATTFAAPVLASGSAGT